LRHNDEEVMPMTITLPLQPQEEALLAAAAQAKGVSTDDFLRAAFMRILADSSTLPETPKAEALPIWDVMLDNVEGISPDEFSRLPHDGASEHDHYLYGHPKSDQ
jgi:hypothetical protein